LEVPELWNLLLLRCARLELYYVLSLQPFWASGDIKLDAIAFVERFEAGCLNRGMVHKHIISRGAANETITLFVVKPLNCSLFSHSCLLS
jgi:hypothetical protein